MPTRFRCPCGKKLKTGDDTIGKKAKCPGCGKWLRVPESATYETVAECAGRKVDKISTALAALDAMRAVRGRDEKRSEPSEPALSAVPGSAAANESDSAFGNKAKLILADSSEDALKSEARMLRNHGYYVIETADGAEALELIRTRSPDAAILDVQLNGLSGFQVVKQLRDVANPLNQRVWQMPVIMTTRKLRGRDKQYAISMGVQGFFPKPINPAQACSRLEKEIAKYRGR